MFMYTYNVFIMGATRCTPGVPAASHSDPCLLSPLAVVVGDPGAVLVVTNGAMRKDRVHPARMIRNGVILDRD